MTRIESRIEEARKREEKAVLELSRAYREGNEAMTLVRKMHGEIEMLAQKELRHARQDLTRLELLSHGITPMHTIFRWSGHYCAVKITADGRAEVFRVTAKNTISRLRGGPSGTAIWENVVVTDRVLVVGD